MKFGDALPFCDVCGFKPFEDAHWRNIHLVFLLLMPFICLKQMGLYDLCHLVNILNSSQISSREDDVIFTEKNKKSKVGFMAPTRFLLLPPK